MKPTPSDKTNVAIPILIDWEIEAESLSAAADTT
jgi:hypothetical protein